MSVKVRLNLNGFLPSMKVQVEISEQVYRFVRAQSPEVRKILREGLRKLEKELGDIKGLEAPLDHFYRLRIRSYRIIFRYRSGNPRVIECVFAEKRNLVYEVFEEMLERG